MDRDRHTGRQANILAGWRQTSRQRQADRHGDVYKHKHNVLEYTQPQGSGLDALGKDQYKANSYT